MNKKDTIKRLEEIRGRVEFVRDEQDVIPCDDGKCICNDFDQIRDKLGNLIEKIKVSKSH